jgi:hypothetical protein
MTCFLNFIWSFYLLLREVAASFSQLLLVSGEWIYPLFAGAPLLSYILNYFGVHESIAEAADLRPIA